jgi:hypothetical protein
LAHDVFICHSSRDKLIADAACAHLERKGIRCWIAPRDILPGVDYAEGIVDGIAQVKVFLLVFSSAANASGQVKREVERAVHRGIPIIPLRIEEVQPSKTLEYFISSSHWLDAYTPPLKRHLEYLADVIQRLLSGQKAPPDGGEPPGPPPAEPAWRRINVLGGAGGAVAVIAIIVLLALAGRQPKTIAVRASSSPVASSSAASAIPSAAGQAVAQISGQWRVSGAGSSCRNSADTQSVKVDAKDVTLAVAGGAPATYVVDRYPTSDSVIFEAPDGEYSLSVDGNDLTMTRLSDGKDAGEWKRCAG